MQRRTFLAATAATTLAATLAAPRVARSQANRIIHFIPQVDVSILDPVTTTAYIARNHGFAVFDTLFGIDSKFAPQPQMLGGVETAPRRQDLAPHPPATALSSMTASPVLAKDCVASVKRWGKRDGFGQALMAATERPLARRRQDPRLPPQIPLPPPARRAGQGRQQHVPHDARAPRHDGSLHLHHRDGRQRPLPLPRRRAHPRCPHRLCPLRRLRPPPERHRRLDQRPQDRPRRPHRAHRHPGRIDRVRRPQIRSDGLVAGTGPRSRARHAQGSRHPRRRARPDRCPGHDAVQPPAAPVQQPGYPPRPARRR